MKWLSKFGYFPTIAAPSIAIGLLSLFLTLLIHLILNLKVLLYGIVISAVLPMLITPPILYIIFKTLTELTETKQALQKLATTDSLTGVPNRARFFELAEQALVDAPPAQPVGLAVIDIDRFKQINDHYGHLVGDAALQAIAKTISYHLRQEDIFGRFGGDEFILLTPNTSSTEIDTIARNLLHQIQIISIGENGSRIPLSVTIGVTAGVPGTTSLRQLIAIADGALLQAKQAGGKSTRYAQHPYPLPNATNGFRG
ncbi:GGDEF domain-containing protein [bacterium]|nr:GGDEF domain-containing protein [bacterium]MCB2179041.1 GGDEF domain-containing protein [bacterium]